MIEVPPSHPFGKLRFLHKFQSKKNNVYLVERNSRRCILKLYANGRWETEYNTLRSAYGRGIPVPRPVEMRDGAILMEYIEGKTINDLIDNGLVPELILGTASWLAGFHLAFYDNGTVLIKSDAIFKNFIVSDRIYGIDFEMSRPGRPEEDVGEAISYLLDTNPMFTEEKFRLARSFIKVYEQESGIRLHDIEDSIVKSLIEAANHRPGQRELILKKAKDIITLKPFTRC